MKWGAAAAFGALAGAMMIYPGEAAEAAWAGLSLWARSVVPVLGPFMICMLMVTTRMKGGAVGKIAFCWMCGSPGGARLLQSFTPRGREAVRLAAMTGTMSPMFFLGTISQWLGSEKAGIVILICHLLGALLVGLCIVSPKSGLSGCPAPIHLPFALQSSAQALLTVGLCMMLGCVTAQMAACAFPRLSPAAAAVLQCILEVTAGTRALIALESSDTIPLVCAACSFGGFSLLLQNAAFWQDSGLKLGHLLPLRLAHGLVSGGICYGVCRLMG